MHSRVGNNKMLNSNPLRMNKIPNKLISLKLQTSYGKYKTRGLSLYSSNYCGYKNRVIKIIAIYWFSGFGYIEQIGSWKGGQMNDIESEYDIDHFWLIETLA